MHVHTQLRKIGMAPLLNQLYANRVTFRKQSLYWKSWSLPVELDLDKKLDTKQKIFQASNIDA